MGELFEIFGRDGFCLQYSIRVVALDRCRNFAFREYEIAAWLIGCHRLYMVALDGCQPTRTATLRMGDKDSVARFLEHGSHGTGNHFLVKIARIGSNLTEELLQTG